VNEEGAPEPRSSSLPAALVLLLAILAVFLPYVSFLGSKVPAARDLPTLFYPLKAHLSEAVRSGQLPWIDRYRWGGVPLLGSPASAPFDPGNILFFVLPLGVATKAWILLRLATAVAGFAAFSRRWGLSSETAAASGVLYGLGGISVSLVPFLSTVTAYSLLPWFGARWIDLIRSPDRRSLLGLSIVSALIFLSSCPEFFFYTAVLGLFLVLTLRREFGSPGKAGRVLGLGTASALLAVGIAAPALLPAISTGERSIRGEGLDERSAEYRALEAVRLPAAGMTAFGILLALGPASYVWTLTVRLFPRS
jgi:hypothetical protein